MLVSFAGRSLNVEIGYKVTVVRCSGWFRVFGETAVLSRVTATQLVFTTESGAVVKTDHSFRTLGKAKKEDYFISLRSPESFGDEFVKSPVIYYERSF